MADKRSFATVPEMFLHRVEDTPDKKAFQFPLGASLAEATGWQSMTWKETAARVRNIACALQKLGVENEQRCAILATTRMEWILADLGILCGSGATTTVYPSNTPDECQYILENSDSRICFAENDEQVAKLVEVRSKLPNLKQVITFDGKAGHDGWVITLSDLEEMGEEHDTANPSLFDDTVASVKGEHLATLIYTSGTTGTPKGVELLHDCWTYTGEGIGDLGILFPEDHQYLWLPLSHSFGKVLEAAQLYVGFTTTVDGRIPKLVDNLGVIKPTFMAAAPRIFEKVYNKVVSGAEKKGGMTFKIFKWAVKVGSEVSKLKQSRKQPGGLLALKFAIADKLVFSKLRARFGGRIRFFISGSAPLSREMAEFFHAADILILEGYGLTESSAASFVNRPATFKFGTVGQALPGTDVKIADSDGEILMKGRGIMRGYHNLPDQTAETLQDGWLLTGDIGEVDGEGFLRITDRKKDLIKTSGGKYVAPQHLEGSLKALCPYISQVVVHGDKRNFCSALITLDEEGVIPWARDQGISDPSIEALGKNDQVLAMIQTAIDTMNKDLPSYETIKKFAVLPKDFTVEDGELTASLKVKRKVVEKKYQDVLDGFYAGALASV